jgi:hypothetical protein
MYPTDLDPNLIGSFNGGPSLLTNPMLPSAAQQAAEGTLGPPMPLGADPSAMNAAVNAQAPTPPMPQQGPSALQGILDKLFHVPSAYQGLLSPEDIRQARAHTLMQLGAGMMGAGLKPGQHATFGGQLANLLGSIGPSWNQNVEGALQQQGQGIGLGNVLMQQEARAAVSQMYPTISEDPDEAQKQYLTMAQAAARAGLPEAKEYIAMANSIRDRSSQGGDRVAPPEWNAAYDKAHPEPPAHTQDHVDWAYNKARQAVNDGYVTSGSQFRTMADAERLAGQFKITSGQRDVALGQGATRIEDAQTKEFEGRPDVKPIIAQLPAINMTQAVLDEAKKGNKAAYESVIGNFAQTVDQKAQLRTQMFEIMSRLDPSMQGRFRIAWTRLMDGTWAPQDLQNVQGVLAAVKAKRMADYTKAYADYAKSHPKAHLVSPDVLFGAPSVQPTGGLVGQPEH